MINSGNGDMEVGKSYFVEDTEGTPCDLCARRTTEQLVPLPWEQRDGSKGVDYACESCRAVLEVAQGLLDNKVKDENEIITTLALAANAGLSWTEKAEQQPENFAREHPGLKFSRSVDGMPLFRMARLLVEVVRYDGTELPKEIRIKVSSRFVEPKELTARYEQTLVKEGIPSDQCPAGSISWSTEDLTLTLTAKPGAEIHLARTRYLPTYPQGQIYHFPPSIIVCKMYETLLGSIDNRTFRGYAYALGDHDRFEHYRKSAKANILACLARCFGESDGSQRPAKRRPRIARALNRHLLCRYGMTELPQESWSPDDAVWRDAREVRPRFNRASYLWQQSNG